MSSFIWCLHNQAAVRIKSIFPTPVPSPVLCHRGDKVSLMRRVVETTVILHHVTHSNNHSIMERDVRSSRGTKRPWHAPRPAQVSVNVPPLFCSNHHEWCGGLFVIVCVVSVPFMKWCELNMLIVWPETNAWARCDAFWRPEVVIICQFRLETKTKWSQLIAGFVKLPDSWAHQSGIKYSNANGPGDSQRRKLSYIKGLNASRPPRRAWHGGSCAAGQKDTASFWG